MVTLKLKLHDEEVKRWLAEMERRGMDLRPAMKKIAVVLMRSAGKQFHVGGIPKWRALSDTTIERRRKKSNVPLRDTGRLGWSWGARGAADIRKIKKTSVFVGSNVIYAAVHQYGRPAMRVQVPEYTRRITTAFGRKIRPKMATVGAHSMGVPKIPKRPVRILNADVEDAKIIITNYILRK